MEYLTIDYKLLEFYFLVKGTYEKALSKKVSEAAEAKIIRELGKIEENIDKIIGGNNDNSRGFPKTSA